MKLKPFAFIIINTLYILIHYFFTINMHCKRLLQMQNVHGVFTACTRRSRRPHKVLFNTLWKRQAAAFVLSMLKINAAGWRSRRLHSVSTAFPQRCWRLHSAHLDVLQFFKRCGNAVRTPLWCDRGLSIGSQKIPPYGFLSLCLLLRYIYRVALAFSKFQAVGKLQNLN